MMLISIVRYGRGSKMFWESSIDCVNWCRLWVFWSMSCLKVLWRSHWNGVLVLDGFSRPWKIHWKPPFFLSLKSMIDDKFVMLPRSNLQPVGSGNRLLCLEVGCKFLQMPFLACKKLSRMGPMHLEIAAYSCARLHRQESQISGSTQMMFSTMFFEFCLLASGPLGKILKLPKSSSRQMEPQTLWFPVFFFDVFRQPGDLR